MRIIVSAILGRMIFPIPDTIAVQRTADGEVGDEDVEGDEVGVDGLFRRAIERPWSRKVESCWTISTKTVWRKPYLKRYN